MNTKTAEEKENAICPYCGKSKRSWRRLDARALCLECDERVNGIETKPTKVKKCQAFNPDMAITMLNEGDMKGFTNEISTRK